MKLGSINLALYLVTSVGSKVTQRTEEWLNEWTAIMISLSLSLLIKYAI
jgi:hypothetical protein